MSFGYEIVCIKIVVEVIEDDFCIKIVVKVIEDDFFKKFTTNWE